MIEQIKQKLQDEQVQRAILSGVAAVSVYVITRAAASQMGKLAESGIDKLMERWHPSTTETPAE